jgi:diguanylate cyclase (GGDEF)-like protein
VGHERDELAARRARSVQHPSVFAPGTRPPVPGALSGAATDPRLERVGAAETADHRADEREAAADARDEAAAARDDAGASRAAVSARVRTVRIPDEDHAALDRLLAARDRVTAAADRRQAALDRRQAAEYLRRTYRDRLTGALQRDAGYDQLTGEVERAHRATTPLVISFLDVDGLKRVNDEQGHAAGDEMLRAVGTALRDGLRSYDVVVRYGGDEFVCALPDTQLADAAPRFEEVGRLLAAASPGATFSIGLAQLDGHEALDSVVRRANGDLRDARATRSA